MGEIYRMATTIQWNPRSVAPENARYILIRYVEKECDECTFGFGCFEHGVYSLSGLDGSWHDLPEEVVLGWSYPIYEK